LELFIDDKDKRVQQLQSKEQYKDSACMPWCEFL
jgi:hypothetical protein